MNERLTQPVAGGPGKAPDAGRIEDLGSIATGGMADIRKVRDVNLQREMAMKVLLPELASRPPAVQRFLDEAQLTAQLDHPGVPPVHALGVDRDGSFFFTLKLVDGRTFEAILAGGGADEGALEAAIEILVRVCDAISFAHSRGIAHCDLKPENVMVGSHRQIYVMDWGIARRFGPGASSLLGTPAYMSPEQANSGPIDARTDVFALGAILYRVLAGAPPYVGDAALEKARAGEIRPLEGAVPRRLKAACLKALSREPGARHADVESFRKELEGFLKGTARLPQLTFGPGETILREGEPADSAYVISRGRCQASKRAGGGEVPLRVMGPGEIFGETALLTGKPRTASVTALEPTTVAVVSRSLLEEEMERTSILALALKAVAGRFQQLDARDGLTRAVFSYLARQSRPESDGSRTAPWGPLARALGGAAGRVSDLPGICVDVAADRITLLPERKAP